ncbi:MAG: glutathione S-transferase family protein [Pseudomonadota bacterium]
MAMQLFMVGASPYARKVLAAAHEHGLAGRIERVMGNPHEKPAALLAKNPLSKVPTLVIEDGTILFDSLTICLYWDSIGQGHTLVPEDPARRWGVLRRHAVAHGLMDAAVIRRVEGWSAQEPDRVKAIAKQKAVCERVVDYCESNIDEFGASAEGHEPTLDALTLGCALGFLDFRFPDDHWRDGHARLAAWYEEIASRPSLTDTMPHD